MFIFLAVLLNCTDWAITGRIARVQFNRDLTNQNATQFENTETEKGPGQERRHERGKTKLRMRTRRQRQSCANPLNYAKHIFVL